MPKETIKGLKAKHKKEIASITEEAIEWRDNHTRAKLECDNMTSIAKGRKGKIDELYKEIKKHEGKISKIVEINANLQKTINQLQNDNYFDKWKDLENEAIILRQSVEDLTAPYKERISSLEQSLSNLTDACTKHIIDMIRGGQ